MGEEVCEEVDLCWSFGCREIYAGVEAFARDGECSCCAALRRLWICAGEALNF